MGGDPEQRQLFAQQFQRATVGIADTDDAIAPVARNRADSAAMPELNAQANSAPSRPASVFSSASIEGFMP